MTKILLRSMAISIACLGFVATVWSPRETRAGEQYAFLVAVGEYDRMELKPLKYTRADIQDFRKTLLDSGFRPGNIVHLHDDPATATSTRSLSGGEYP